MIIASQLPALFGLGGPLSSLAHSPLPPIDLQAIAFGAASLAAMVLGRRHLPRVPMVMLVVAGSALLSKLSGYAEHGAVIGALPAGLPTPYWPGLPDWHQFGALIPPALVLTLVTSLETAASGKIEAQRDGRRWDDNQDLIGQGLAKFASGFSGSFATSTSFSRSAITLYAGARTGWATIAATVFVVLTLLFLTPALYYVPRAVLAAIVVLAVAGLVKPRALLGLWRVDRVEAVIAFITFGVTLLTAPRIYWGVLTGVLLSLSYFLHHRLHPRIVEVGLHADGSLRDRHAWELPPLAPDLYALRMDAELDFASASDFERTVIDHLALHPDVRRVCLFAHPINRIDATGLEVFGQVRRLLQERGIALHLSGIKLPVQRVLERAGLLQPGPLLHLYRTDAEALEALRVPVRDAQQTVPASEVGSH